MARKSGILLHISSLPSKYGIGTFGIEAYKFVDFLVETNQSFWQFLPLGPTSYGDSPYQSFSNNALNPYFIDLDLLVEDNLLTLDEIMDSSNGTRVDYGKLYMERFNTLKLAFNRFNLENNLFKDFLNENSEWIYDYADFMAIRKSFGDSSLIDWPKEIRTRNNYSLNKILEELKDEVNFQLFLQFQAYTQYMKLKKYANKKGINIIGDIPIYVSYDSSDLWVNPNLFMLDEENIPTYVAGVPPDSFSKDGQLWGNPLYNWNNHKNTNFKWWINRIKNQTKLFDMIRVDHFIGFVNYFKIPAKDKTAVNGVWEKALGRELFIELKKELGNLNIIAEDLGVVTNEVKALLKETGFPGMKVLQFAFNPNEESDYLPHLYSRNSVAYTGTHDNETTKEWFEKLNKEELEYCLSYINCSNDELRVDSFIKEILKSPADLAIIPMQDYLNLGSEARMNKPSTSSSNWQWRLEHDFKTIELVNKIKNFTKLYGRANK